MKAEAAEAEAVEQNKDKDMDGNKVESVSLVDVQQELIEEFSFFDDWADKYQHVIDQGKRLCSLSDEERVETNLLHGCVSQVWMISDVLEDAGERRLRFRADSDSLLVRGLIALVLRVYNDRSPSKILDCPPNFLKTIGLHEYLSPSRSNGLAAMVAHIFKVAHVAR